MRSMKQTNIPWLGEIPEGWGLKAVKKIFKIHIGFTPLTSNEEFFKGDNLWANISDLGDKTIYNTKTKISNKAIKKYRGRISKAGSLLLSFKLSMGLVSFCALDMYTNQAIATFEESDVYNLNFLYYVAPLYITKNARINAYGAPLMNKNLILNTNIPTPPLKEQEEIARYLDEKCYATDKVIELYETLIEKLKEYKKSLIYECVTKGLDK